MKDADAAGRVAAGSSPGRRAYDPNRWLILAVCTFGQMCFSAFLLGLPSIVPAFRTTYHASLTAIGAVLTATGLGLVATLFVWGLATDRFGERLVMSLGLLGTAVGLLAAASVTNLVAVTVLLATAASFGASVNSSTGKAIMVSFERSQRGLALSIRQAGMLVAGAAAALTLPRVASAEGLRSAFVILAVVCLLGSLVSALLLRDGASLEPATRSLPTTLRDARLWRLSIGSSFLCVAQTSIVSFVVVFLHDRRGLTPASAALVLGGIQIVGGVLRILSGMWSDRVRSRVVPLRRIAFATFLALVAAAVLLHASLVLLFPAFIIAGGIAMSWNAVSFAAAAELGGAARSGAALGLQQTVVGLSGALTPVLFAIAVEGSSWRVAWIAAALFPLAGWWVIRRIPVGTSYRPRLLRGRAAIETERVWS